MKLFDCPELGERPLSEFVYGGAVRAAPSVDATDDAWAEHVFHRHGAPALRTEWWYHRPSGTWFWVTRDTASDAVAAVRSASTNRTEENAP
ncbi:MAG TPA: sarcosine oxidase subunit delta [Polyangiaceae bacterium]|jgi:sarcosine oxidase subunit delta|nr:sarcosine oxidase subunit delta [Polyangiaceae bacterium]